MVSDTKYLEICHDESFVDIDLLFFKVRIQGGSTKFTHSFIEKHIKEWVNLVDPLRMCIIRVSLLYMRQLGILSNVYLIDETIIDNVQHCNKEPGLLSTIKAVYMKKVVRVLVFPSPKV